MTARADLAGRSLQGALNSPRRKGGNMTTYKLLIESPKYAKTLETIRRMAKREKKTVEMVGQDISFVGVIYPKYTGKPEYKEITGSGVLITVA
jgi:hypothetical protein